MARYAAHDFNNHMPAKAIMFTNGRKRKILKAVSERAGYLVRNSCLSVNNLYKAKQLPASMRKINIV